MSKAGQHHTDMSRAILAALQALVDAERRGEIDRVTTKAKTGRRVAQPGRAHGS